MIQRILYKALTAGLTYFSTNQDAYDRLFGQNYGLSATEVAAIRQFFAAKPVTVVHGYARMDQTPPMLAIVLGSEREVESVIGDEAGPVRDELDPDYRCDQYTSMWAHNYQIHCIAEHPEASQYLYEIAKAIILEAKESFIPEGIYDSEVSGSELLPDPRYIPENWFVRVVTFACRRELLTTRLNTALGKAWKVSGIHVDSDGSPSDVGGVKTLIHVV